MKISNAKPKQKDVLPQDVLPPIIDNFDKIILDSTHIFCFSDKTKNNKKKKDEAMKNFSQIIQEDIVQRLLPELEEVKLFLQNIPKYIQYNWDISKLFETAIENFGSTVNEAQEINKCFEELRLYFNIFSYIENHSAFLINANYDSNGRNQYVTSYHYQQYNPNSSDKFYSFDYFNKVINQKSSLQTYFEETTLQLEALIVYNQDSLRTFKIICGKIF